MTRKEILYVQMMEKAGEITQEVSKCLSFGTSQTFPAKEGSNESRLMQEIIDLLAIIELCQFEGFVPAWPVDVRERMDAKKAKVAMTIEQSTWK